VSCWASLNSAGPGFIGHPEPRNVHASQPTNPRSMGLVPAKQLVCRVSLRRACQVVVEAQCPCKATQLVSMERLGHDQRNCWGWRRMLSIMTQHQQVRHSSHAPDNQPTVVCSAHMLRIPTVCPFPPHLGTRAVMLLPARGQDDRAGAPLLQGPPNVCWIHSARNPSGPRETSARHPKTCVYCLNASVLLLCYSAKVAINSGNVLWFQTVSPAHQQAARCSCKDLTNQDADGP
jgi:hypothetical protein